jgi:hypothetical protein
MKVRNNYTTTIGVGTITILPDAVVELPDKFGKTHPVIAYYLSQKWLTEVGKEPKTPVSVPPIKTTVGAEVKTEGTPVDTGEGGNAEETPNETGEVKTEETPVDNVETQEQKPAEGSAKKKK